MRVMIELDVSQVRYIATVVLIMAEIAAANGFWDEAQKAAALASDLSRAGGDDEKARYAVARRVSFLERKKATRASPKRKF